jgi:hypothetical protein
MNAEVICLRDISQRLHNQAFSWGLRCLHAPLVAVVGTLWSSLLLPFIGYDFYFEKPMGQWFYILREISPFLILAWCAIYRVSAAVVAADARISTP